MYLEFLLIALAVYTLLCELYPQSVSKWNSCAFSSTFASNVRSQGIEFQGILYELFHSTWICRVTHWTIFTDAVAWFAIVHEWGGLAAVAVCVTGLVAQSLTFRNPLFTAYTMVFYMALLAVAFRWETFADHSTEILVIGAGLRVIGHVFEPAPPLMFDGDKPQLEFHHKEGAAYHVLLRYVLASPKHMLALIWSPVVGFVSELQAGLPYRLLHYAVYIVVQRLLGKQINQQPSSPSRRHILSVSKHISVEGWNGWGVTREMFRNVAPEDATAALKGEFFFKKQM